MSNGRFLELQSKPATRIALTSKAGSVYCPVGSVEFHHTPKANFSMTTVAAKGFGPVQKTSSSDLNKIEGDADGESFH